jgi:hypothetical protein
MEAISNAIAAAGPAVMPRQAAPSDHLLLTDPGAEELKTGDPHARASDAAAIAVARTSVDTANPASRGPVKTGQSRLAQLPQFERKTARPSCRAVRIFSSCRPPFLE